MIIAKADILARLKMDILPLAGLHSPAPGESIDLGLGRINEAFPQNRFPLGAVHEFVCEGLSSQAATVGFISGLLAKLMKDGAAVLWIASLRNLFPPALKTYGIQPNQVIFIEGLKEKEVLWTMEQALGCEGLAAVIGEMPELSFTASRRFQLAVEQSRVTGFIIRPLSRSLNTNSCVSRWKISSLPSHTEDDLPGLGFPRWQVDLLKIRNGKPGSWQLEWAAGRFRHISEIVPAIATERERKRG